MEEDLFQVAVLIDQLKHSDCQLRIIASKALPRIARALGPERTRDELIPFLNDTTDEMDEPLVVTAGIIGELCGLVGGAEYVHTLLGPLTLFASIEEAAIRSAVSVS